MILRLAPGLSFDLESPAIKASGSRTYVLGESGSGKSAACSSIAGQLLAGGKQVFFLDMHGENAGLWALAPAKVSRFGYGEPLPPIDVEDPESITAAVELMMAAVRRGQSVLINLREWAVLEPAKLDAFALAFIRALYAHRVKHPGFSLLVVEEAQQICMPLDTEVLTPDGWKHRNEIAVGTEVVAMNIATGLYKNERVQQVIDRYHSGDMYHFKTNRLDQLVTPEHRAVIRRIQRGKGRYHDYPLSFCTAKKVPGNIKVPFGGAPYGPGVPGITNEDLRILGWLITDGSMHSRETAALTLSQAISTKKDNVPIAEEMRRVLVNYGIKHTTRPPKRTGTGGMSGPSYAWYFGVESSRRWLRWWGPGPYGRADIHRIPRVLLRDGTREQLLALYEGLLEGDGGWSRGRWTNFFPGIKNLKLKDDFQEIATRLGISTVLRPTLFSPTPHHFVSLRNERNVEHCMLRRPTKEHFEGPVWDITVPSGAFVARRNGTVFVTGNCPQAQSKGQSENVKVVVNITTDGRKYGLHCLYATQRQSLVDVSVLACCNVRIFLRLTDLRDWKKIRDAIPEKLGMTFEKISHFANGEAVVTTPWTRAARVKLFMPEMAPRV